MTKNKTLEDRINSKDVRIIEIKSNPYKIKRNQLEEFLDDYYKKINKKRDLYEDEISVTEDGIVIRKVTEYVIGKDVFGRAFIYKGYIEILDRLNGQDYEVIKGHEIYHLKNPSHSEYKTRIETGTNNWEPRKYLSSC